MVRDWEDVIWAQRSIVQCALLTSKILLHGPTLKKLFCSSDVQSQQQLTYRGLCHIFSFALVSVQTLAKLLHLASPCHAVWVIWSWQVLWDMAESGRVLFERGWGGGSLGFLMSAPCLLCSWSVVYWSVGTLETLTRSGAWMRGESMGSIASGPTRFILWISFGNWQS